VKTHNASLLDIVTVHVHFVVQAVCHIPVITKTHVQSPDSVCGICDGADWYWDRFLSEYIGNISVSLPSYFILINSSNIDAVYLEIDGVVRCHSNRHLAV